VKIPSILEDPANTKTVRSKDWLRLYGLVHVLRNNYLLHTRSVKEVRAACMSLLSLLKSRTLASGISGDVRGVLAQLWFAAREQLIVVAGKNCSIYFCK
jgi:hypothetical protein